MAAVGFIFAMICIFGVYVAEGGCQIYPGPSLKYGL